MIRTANMINTEIWPFVNRIFINRFKSALIKQITKIHTETCEVLHL